MALRGTLAPITGTVVANSGVTLMARILGQAGTLITQASLSTIQYSIRNLTTGTTSTALTSAGSVSSLVYNDLQQGDPRWELTTGEDANNLGADGRHGFNFLLVLASTLFTTFTVESSSPFKVTESRFQVSAVFTPVTGQKFHVPFQFLTVASWE